MGKAVAIVGASGDRSKYGNKSVRAHASKGWDVYPVNPRVDEVEGLKCYPDVKSVPVALDRISVYLPPKVARPLLAEWRDSGASECYFNPGSADDELLEEATRLRLPWVDACSIVDLGLKPSMFPDR